jgi:hypothetical protein
MGGDIQVASEPGSGSTFTVWLPPNEYVNADKRGSSESVDGQSFGFRILVVEDNAVNQIVTEGLLRKLRYASDCAYDGEDALPKVRSQLAFRRLVKT